MTVLKAGVLNADTGDLRVVVVPRNIASVNGLRGGSRVRVVSGSRFVTAWVVVSEEDGEEVLLSKSVSNTLNNPDKIELCMHSITPSVDYIKKKLKGFKLSEDEIRSIIRDITSGALGVAEIATFVAAQTSVGMDIDEIVSLTKAMVETGNILKFDEPAHDIHSIGGVPGNSKVSLVTVPIIAAAGVFIPKTSSRAITSPAGTADTMEVFAPVSFTEEEVLELAKKVKGFIIWGGTLNLAPADDILIRVEHQLKLDPTSQMVASILSKKLSMSISSLIIDIPTGREAKVENINEARNLSSLFVQVGSKLELSVRCAITYGGQPIGYTVGPALEALEALETLMGSGPMSVREKAAALAGLVLEVAGVAPRGGGRKIALNILESGRALQTFLKIIEAMGGNPHVKPDEIPVGRYKAEVKAPIDGYVTAVYNNALSRIAMVTGAPQDKGAGLRLHVKKGHKVKEGQTLLEIYSNSESLLDEALKLVEVLKPIVIEGMLLETFPEYL
ncbi:MAG: AMP phosphorylase [Desulfurococcaceae archaeon TW002]